MNNRLKALAAVITLLLPVFASAEDISLSKAQGVAEKFFIKSGMATRGSSHLTLVNKDEVAQTRSASDAYFYIFNRAEGGFVIISALDAACPVLGYSFEGSFSMDEDMPENLREWLDLYRQQIAERRASGKPATQEELARWQEAESIQFEGLPTAIDLKTPDWGQGSPFNKLCPNNTSGEKCIAGCVTISSSELCGYYKYPKAASGTLPGYTKNSITVGSITLGHEYDWNNILPKYSGVSYTTAQADAVARLVYDIAVMAQVSFGHSGTGGSTATSVYRLTNYFGFSKAAVRYAHTYMSDKDWKDLLKSQIGNKMPVLFAGESSSGGAHSFIIDGYDSNDNFLINWGWNGSSNGYYKLSSFGSYTSGQVAYTDLKPDDGARRAYTFFLRTATHDSKEYNGFTYQSGTIAQGSSFTIRFGNVYNYGFTVFSGEFNFAHKDKDGNIKGWLRTSPLTLSSLDNKSATYWINDQTLKVTEPIERGDYAEPMFRPNGDPEWHRFANADNDGDNVNTKIPMHIKDYTSVKYSKSKKTFTLSTLKGMPYTITGPDNVVIRSSKTTLTDTALNMSSFASGTYTLEVGSGNDKLTIKLTI
ncbi:MAG: C10 family peptidase [Bacteroidales bacterium]|nr:C10 family peptidase [Bacteroidales bacterium]